jgi:hypothetical protein
MRRHRKRPLLEVEYFDKETLDSPVEKAAEPCKAPVLPRRRQKKIIP